MKRIFKREIIRIKSFLCLIGFVCLFAGNAWGQTEQIYVNVDNNEIVITWSGSKDDRLVVFKYNSEDIKNELNTGGINLPQGKSGRAKGVGYKEKNKVYFIGKKLEKGEWIFYPSIRISFEPGKVPDVIYLYKIDDDGNVFEFSKKIEQTKLDTELGIKANNFFMEERYDEASILYKKILKKTPQDSLQLDICNKIKAIQVDYYDKKLYDQALLEYKTIFNVYQTNEVLKRYRTSKIEEKIESCRGITTVLKHYRKKDCEETLKAFAALPDADKARIKGMIDDCEKKNQTAATPAATQQPQQPAPTVTPPPAAAKPIVPKTPAPKPAETKATVKKIIEEKDYSKEIEELEGSAKKAIKKIAEFKEKEITDSISNVLRNDVQPQVLSLLNGTEGLTGTVSKEEHVKNKQESEERLKKLRKELEKAKNDIAFITSIIPKELKIYLISEFRAHFNKSIEFQLDSVVGAHIKEYKYKDNWYNWWGKWKYEKILTNLNKNKDKYIANAEKFTDSICKKQKPEYREAAKDLLANEKDNLIRSFNDIENYQQIFKTDFAVPVVKLSIVGALLLVIMAVIFILVAINIRNNRIKEKEEEEKEKITEKLGKSTFKKIDSSTHGSTTLTNHGSTTPADHGSATPANQSSTCFDSAQQPTLSNRESSNATTAGAAATQAANKPKFKQLYKYDHGLADVKSKVGAVYKELDMFDFADSSSIRKVYISRDVIKDLFTFFTEFTKSTETGCYIVGRWDYVPDSNQEAYDISLEYTVKPGRDATYSEYECNFGAEIGTSLIMDNRKYSEQTNTEYVHTSWVHSHPGLQLFLSQQDLVVQSTLTNNSPYKRMLAIVIDTIDNFKMGFFTPKSGSNSTMNNAEDMKKTITLGELYHWAQTEYSEKEED